MITMVIDERTHRLIEHAMRAFSPVSVSRLPAQFQVSIGDDRYDGAELNDAYNAVAGATGTPLRAFLDISTLHLRPETRELWGDCLDAEHFPGNVLVGPSGWLVHVPSENPEWDYRYGTELFAIFDHARAAGADYVMFDRDAEPVSDLEVFPEGEGATAEEEDEGCPVGDPDCLSGDGECHDACEAPAEAPFSPEEDAFVRALEVQHYDAGAIARMTSRRFGHQRTRSAVAVRLADLAIGEAVHG